MNYLTYIVASQRQADLRRSTTDTHNARVVARGPSRLPRH